MPLTADGREYFAYRRAEVQADIDGFARWQREAVDRIPQLEAKIAALETAAAEAAARLAEFEPAEQDIWNEKGWLIRRMSDGKRAAVAALAKLTADLETEQNWLVDARLDLTGRPDWVQPYKDKLAYFVELEKSLDNAA